MIDLHVQLEKENRLVAFAFISPNNPDMYESVWFEIYWPPRVNSTNKLSQFQHQCKRDPKARLSVFSIIRLLKITEGNPDFILQRLRNSVLK